MGNTIKSFKKAQKKSFRKTDMIDLGDGFSLPIKSLSAMEFRKDVNLEIEKPIIERKMNDTEVEEYLKIDSKVSKTMVKNFYVAEFDLTNEDYQNKLTEAKEIENFLYLTKYVDLNYKTENEEELWEDLELKSNADYVGLAKKIFLPEEEGGLNLGESFVSKMTIAIRALENDPVLMKLSKLQKMYDDKSEFEMLDDLLSLEETKNQIKEINLELLELRKKVAESNEKPAKAE